MMIKVQSKMAHDFDLHAEGFDSLVLTGTDNATSVVDGYATTEIPDDFWAEWMKDHPDYPALKHGWIREG